MPVKRLRATAIPDSRFQSSVLSDTKEWRETLNEIKKGLTVNESLQVRLSPETVATIPIKDPTKAFYVALKRHVTRHEYPVNVFIRANAEGEGGQDVWVIGSPTNGKRKN